MNVIMNIKAKEVIIDCAEDSFKITFQKQKSKLDSEQSLFYIDRELI